MTAVPLPALISPNPNCPGRVSERIYLYSLLLAGFPDFALWRKEAMSDGDVDAVTKDTGYGRVLGEIIRDWGVACAKRRAECLIKLVSKTVPNLSTASGGGRLATDYNKFTRRCRVVAQSARRSAASYFGPTGLPGQAGGAQAGQPGLAHSPLFTHTGSGDATRPGHVADDYNPQVPPQADPAPRPDGEDVTLDSDL